MIPEGPGGSHESAPDCCFAAAGGVDQNTIGPGNQVSVTAWTARDGTKYGNVRNLLLPDGRNLDVGDTWPQR
jgi:hypothetical protein